MKTLLLLRHGKSPHHGTTDHQRPLDDKAREKDIPAIAGFARENSLIPDWAISSDARRAADTATCFLASLGTCDGVAAAALLLPQLYLSTGRDMLTEIQSVPASVQTLLVVGHNPSIENLGNLLTRKWTEMKPGTLLVLEADCASWLELAPHGATVRAVAYPRKLEKR